MISLFYLNKKGFCFVHFCSVILFIGR